MFYFYFQEGTGERSVLVVGDSYALNQVELIREELKEHNYKRFSVFSLLGNSNFRLYTLI